MVGNILLAAYMDRNIEHTLIDILIISMNIDGISIDGISFKQCAFAFLTGAF